MPMQYNYSPNDIKRSFESIKQEKLENTFSIILDILNDIGRLLENLGDIEKDNKNFIVHGKSRQRA
jgi:hypothetical protein